VYPHAQFFYRTIFSASIVFGRLGVGGGGGGGGASLATFPTWPLVTNVMSHPILLVTVIEKQGQLE
jgi:hypothetical protein